MSSGGNTLINYEVLHAYYDSIEEVHIYKILFICALVWALCCSGLVCCVCLKYRSVNTRFVDGLVQPSDVQKRFVELKPLISRR